MMQMQTPGATKSCDKQVPPKMRMLRYLPTQSCDKQPKVVNDATYGGSGPYDRIHCSIHSYGDYTEISAGGQQRGQQYISIRRTCGWQQAAICKDVQATVAAPWASGAHEPLHHPFATLVASYLLCDAAKLWYKRVTDRIIPVSQTCAWGSIGGS
eukprot:jgi/Ulvmu1/5735/UM245_0003.1